MGKLGSRSGGSVKEGSTNSLMSDNDGEDKSEFHSFRSDVSVPDARGYLELMTLFPTLPVIGMFKNELLPVGTPDGKGSDDDMDDIDEESEKEEDIAQNVCEVEPIIEEDVISHDDLGADNEVNEAISRCTSNNPDIENVDSRSPPLSSHITTTEPRLTRARTFNIAPRRQSENDKFSSWKSNPDGFQPRRKSPSRSFNMTSKRRNRSDDNYANYDPIKAKEFEVARADAKRKRLKRRILRWMQDYEEKIRRNEHPSEIEAQEELSKLNNEYDEVSYCISLRNFSLCA